MNPYQPPERPPPTLREDLASLPQAYWVLCAGAFINRVGTFVFPFLTIYLTDRGFGPSQAKLALTAHGAGHLLAAIVGGWLADRIGRRNTIALSMYCAAASLIALSHAQPLWLIMVCALLTGLTLGAYHPAAHALLADLIPPEKRVRANTVLRIAINAGWAVGVALAGIIAAYGYHWLFYGDAFTCAIFGTLSLVFLPHGVRRAGKQARWADAIAVLRKDRPFIALFVANFCAALVFTQMSTTFALQVTDAGFSKKFFGFLLAGNGVLILLFELPISNLTSRLPPRPVLAVGFLLVGLGFAINLFGHSAAVLVAVILVFTLGEMIALPVSGARVAELAPESMRGRYMGAYGLSWGLATVIGPSGLSIYEQNPNLLWLISALLGVASAAAVFVIKRKPGRKAASSL